jgi:hypothetical protein
MTHISYTLKNNHMGWHTFLTHLKTTTWDGTHFLQLKNNHMGWHTFLTRLKTTTWDGTHFRTFIYEFRTAAT